MKTKATAGIIIIGFIIVFSRFDAPAIDTPHSASNNVSCGSCHGAALLNSPFWGGTMSYDQICLNCHRASSGPYTDTNAPLVKTHSSLNTDNGYGDWTRECRTCHDPHYQRQKNYKTTDAGNLYLATGTITSCKYNCDGTSTLTYSIITYKSGWDATKLTEKTGDYRRTILFPNVGKLGYNYPAIAIDTPTAKTITVTGNATTFLCPQTSSTCPNPYSCNLSTTFAILYGQYIKDFIDVSGTNKTVKFFDQTGTKSFADGDTTYNGVCEVCHTQTTHFRYGGGVPEQNHENICEGVRTNCIRCHKHKNGFGHGGGGGEVNCEECHGHENDWTGGPYYGTTTSHSTHTESDGDDVRGPFLVCINCHNNDLFPCFKSGVDSNGDVAYNLSETNVCDGCHSPGGAFNGVISEGGSVGARDNWVKGIYQDDGTLTPGKEKWCAGCHDNVPSVVKGTTAPNIVGDNSTYGYYLDAHGDTSYGVSRQGVTYSKGECLHCHEVSVAGHGGQLFDTSINFCFKCHDNTYTYATSKIFNRSYSYRAGGWTSDSLDDILEAFTNPPSISSHNLGDLTTFITGKWGYTADSNPCDACHNPHIAQGDPVNSPNVAKSPTTRGYPVARPSQHSTNYNNLWGDDTSERLNPNYTNSYQAPYRYNSFGAYEPDGSGTTDGTNMTDVNTFCTDCHNATNTISSTTLGTLKTIDWDNEKHGKGNAADDAGFTDLKLPYSEATRYVLACTDCHEPHGSPNVFLIRKWVNNITPVGTLTNVPVTVTITAETGVEMTRQWKNLCLRCHLTELIWSAHHPPRPGLSCVGANGCHFPLVSSVRVCIECHYHGSTSIRVQSGPVPYNDGEHLF